MFSVESEATIPSKLSPADLVLKAERRRTVHLIFLVMLATVIHLFIVVTAKRF